LLFAAFDHCLLPVHDDKLGQGVEQVAEFGEQIHGRDEGGSVRQIADPQQPVGPNLTLLDSTVEAEGALQVNLKVKAVDAADVKMELDET